jgi:acyl carrier protein
MSDVDGDILVRVSTAIRSTFRLPGGFVVTGATTSADVDGWDSLSHSILIMSIEDDFGIELPLERAVEVHDVGALVELIRVTQAESGPA